MKVYLVIYETYVEQFGSYKNLLGIFSSEDKAKAAVNSYDTLIKDYHSKANGKEKQTLDYLLSDPDNFDYYYKPQIIEVELDEIRGISFHGYLDVVTINCKPSICLGGYAE